MTDVELVLPVPHPGQAKVKAERDRFNVLAMGRRFGKTTMFLDGLLDDPDYGALAGHPVGWFAATSKIFDEVWRLMIETLPPEVIQRTDSRNHRIELYTGGVIDFWSLDGADRGGAGRGRKYRRIAVDEAALVPGLLQVWSRAIRPTLVDLQGDAWFASTPRGLLNDFHTMFQRGQPGPDKMKNWRSWRLPTASNPHISREELADLEREYAGRPLDYRQEILAEFVEDLGQVFDLEWLRDDTPAPKNWKPEVYQAWDLAGTKQDLEDKGCESVGVAIAQDWLQRWWLLDVVRGKWNPGALVEQILSFAWKHRAFRVWGEDPIALWLEDNIRRRCRETGRHIPFQRVSVQGRGDKVARAQAAIVPVMVNGSFYVDAKAPWYPGVRSDLSAFPAAGKDFVDALSLAFAEAMGIARQSAAPTVAGTENDATVMRGDQLKEYKNQLSLETTGKPTRKRVW